MSRQQQRMAKQQRPGLNLGGIEETNNDKNPISKMVNMAKGYFKWFINDSLISLKPIIK